MRWFEIVGAYVVGSTSLVCAWHYASYGCLNSVFVALAFFWCLNGLISLWEIALWRHIDVIEADYKKLKAKHSKNPLRALLDQFVAPMPWSKVFTLRGWTSVWSLYSLYDPSYSDKRSYGFFIDIGNGHSMLLPSFFWLFNVITGGPLSPRWLGILGLICFYQMWYGTVLYFTSFFANKRHHGHTVLEICIFVGVSNGIWFTFPLLGMWASVQLILQDSLACLLCAAAV